ncbi:DUF2851 family protein [Gangjinia marincola]|uniref:DUF2851 family protein n=1 Tax=Gangjinia marincola TaxID=578463 RepID=A0ABN1MDM5_9FLAO
MKEDYLHYLWKYKKFAFAEAKTTAGEEITLVKTGEHNQHSGPDFFAAQLKIGDQNWAGNVEIHLKSSDWYVHGHESDPAYDNVILHVVWEHDVEVFRKDNTVIPTLNISTYVNKDELKKYQHLIQRKGAWINCEKDFSSIDGFELALWLERVFTERLQDKTKVIDTLLDQYNNDWEAVLFMLLSKSMGLNVNGEAFLNMAQHIPFNVIRRVRTDQQDLEALFFGMTGMLDEIGDVPYGAELKKRFEYLAHKFQLKPNCGMEAKFFRLRPDNFPTIRLAQLAAVYSKHADLFSGLISAKTKKEGYDYLEEIDISPFWKTHYTFSKEGTPRKKKLTKSFMDLLLINAVVPIQFSYAVYKGRDHSELFRLVREVAPEKNSISKGFNALRENCVKSALESQAVIQLKREYCDKNRCLRCAIGIKLISQES